MTDGAQSYELNKLHRQWSFSFSASHTVLPARGTGGGRKQGVGKGQNQDNWPKLAKGIFHTIWQHAIKPLENGGELARGIAAAQELAGLQLLAGMQLLVHHLFYKYIHIYVIIITIIIFPLPFSVLVNSFHLNPWVLFFSPPFLSPIPLGGKEVSKWLCGV